MSKFYVNGKQVEFPDDKKLITILREDLKLKSVKDGCSEGACGTCTVIIDGKAMKCCVQKAKNMEGKHITTVEGLSDREKEVWTYAFGKCGAVQCGFCIPGMIMSGKALIDENPTPTETEVAFAIRNNICRCTGYKKIIKGILLAADMLKNNTPVIKEDNKIKVGDSVIRCDVEGKVLGTAKYSDDVDEIDLPGMLFCSAVRSKYPRAKVKKIDIEAAKKVPGVVAVYTAKDIPGSKITGHLNQDWHVMIEEGDITHMLGDAIVTVVGESWEAVDAGKAAVVIDFEELETIDNPYRAMENDCPKIHPNGNILVEKLINRGDVDKAFNEAKYVVTEKFKTPIREHAFLEPECAVAFPFDNDGIYLYSSDQSTYDTRRECATVLGIPQEKLVVENLMVGGAFGGKEDMSIQTLACIAAYLLKKPVKAKLTRQESMITHPKGHPMDMEMSMCCDENGIITGYKATIISDTGAYASLGGPVLERACTHAPGPYSIPNVYIKGTAVYTNNPPSGAFRGFGVTQSCFGTEMLINLLAEKVGIDPFEIRYKNAVRPGSVMCNGQIADESTGIVETLDAVRDYYYKEKIVGIACAMKNAGVGVGLPDYGRCRLLVKNGIVEIHAGASENGQGVGSVLEQTVAGELGLKQSQVKWMNSATNRAPDSGCSSGSRHTLITGEAALAAAKKLHAEYDGDLTKLEGKEYTAEYFEPTDKFGSDKPNPKSHIAYGYATQVCILNEDGTIKQMVAAHEVGKAVSTIAVEGQIEGGVTMSLGYALTENYAIEKAVPKVKYGTLGLFKADKVPPIVPIIVEKKGIKYSNGSIGCGEIVSIPTAPAVAGAYYKLDKQLRCELPLKNTAYSKKA